MTDLYIVGISGYARSGKDEAAKALETAGYKRMAFADALREVLYRLDPYIGPYTRLSWLVDNIGWEKAKIENQEVRALLQRMGTDAGRNVLGYDIWVNAVFRGMFPKSKYVITDCRFTNEADAINSMGGRVLRINRPGVGPVNNHPSETQLDNYPNFYATINNDGTLQEFHEAVRKLICE